MFRILRKEELAPSIKLIEVHAPLIARKAKPGQFVVVRVREEGERIPLTLADWKPNAGTVTIVFQEVGVTSMKLGELEEGDQLLDLLGPLGQPTHIEKFGIVVCVPGGVGTAPLFPIARALQEAGNMVITCMGARSKNLLFWVDRMRSVSDEVLISTDDGSFGFHGFTTDLLKQVISRGTKVDMVFTAGPAIMMKKVAEVTALSGIPTIASLNAMMVDGTGMCGVCRVMIDGKTKFTCVDGPDFDAHKVDFDHLLSRLSVYKAEEKAALERYLERRGAK
ncbi:MAG: sulfide/dihydroorotate dehydrogenase-like FAD/NAD-binding protein [Caldiserica bacterium]|nr:sulfide/dihydroorotate dehydrogenase-like FAD/NAD-binding protein [Caldisericota bacterium]MDH7562480.1 sulfide/dihydroorotate dehydrogenase-like FAD/NAD-binding protein [Caldisericota bacterium]